MTYFGVKIEFTITVHFFFSGGTETTVWKKNNIKGELGPTSVGFMLYYSCKHGMDFIKHY